MVELMSVFKYINSLPDEAIYVIEDESKKEVYINHTVKLKTKLGEISSLLGAGDKKLVVQGNTKKGIQKLVDCEFMRLQYINKGWQVINQKYPFVSFSIRVNVGTHPTAASVVLISSRGQKIFVGRFKTVKEAEEFRRVAYPNGWAGRLVYKQGEGGDNNELEVESNEVTQTDRIEL